MPQISSTTAYVPPTITSAAGNTTPAAVDRTSTVTTGSGVVGSYDVTTAAPTATATSTTSTAPAIAAPNTSLIGGDLMVAVQAALDKAQQNKSKSVENQVQAGKEQSQKVGQARLDTLQSAGAKTDIPVLTALFNYAVKNPGQLIGFALTLVPAVVGAVPSGGATLAAAAPALAGQALIMVNGVMAEAGMDTKQFVASITQSVLVAVGVDQGQAQLIAAASTSGLFLAVEIGTAVASGGKTMPNAASFGQFAMDIANTTGMSLYAAGSINATVTQLASFGIAIGGGLASLGTAYGGLDQIFAKSGDLAGLIGQAAQGNVDLAGISQAWSDMQPLMQTLVAQLQKDSGGLEALWQQIQDTYQQVSAFVQAQGQNTTPITNQQPTFA